MANLGLFEVLQDSTPADISAVAKTATFNTKGYKIGGLDIVGLFLDVNTVTGTSPTLDIKMQFSADGGTTWLDTYPMLENSETQATVAQITAAKETAKFWPAWPPAIRLSSEAPQVRWVFTIGGTNPSFTMTAYIIGRGFGDAGKS